jgi:hypothetical protein
MKKYSRNDQILMAAWAADCALRVLKYFERDHPADDRPRAAIAAARKWVRTGVSRMAEIRGASLASHAAARRAKAGGAAQFAARAAGQAVATAHVPQHAYGGALYALKAIAADDPSRAEVRVTREWTWQARRLPKHLRTEIMSRLSIRKLGGRIEIRLQKDKDF